MKVKPIIARNAAELAEIFGLSPDVAVEWETRRQINDKIVAAVKESGLTRAQVAKAAGTSRSRVRAAAADHDTRSGLLTKAAANYLQQRHRASQSAGRSTKWIAPPKSRRSSSK